MDDKEVMKKWLDVFGKNVHPKIMRNHVLAEYNFLWHIFTWGSIECFEEDEAKTKLDSLKDEEVIYFTGGYNNEIQNLSIIKKPTSYEIDIDEWSDIYVTAKDFSWTYVKTHESGIGPYFAFGTAKVNKKWEARVLKAIKNEADL